MDYYLTFGLDFYVASALINQHTFKNATPGSIFCGLILGIILWPIGIAVLYLDNK